MRPRLASLRATTRLRLMTALASALAAAPAAAQPAGAICPSSTASIDKAAAATMAQGSPGMAVAVGQSGRVLFERGYGFADLEHRVPMTTDTVFSLASVTKQFTAAAILLLAEEGKLSLDDPVSKYVPELPHGGRISVYQLLVQTSGLPDYSEDPEGSKTKSVAKTPAEMLAWIVRLSSTLQFEPGTRWAYSNSNYVLLGLIVERRSGEPLGDFFKRRLFVPAGLRDTHFDNPADVVPHRARGYRKDRQAPSGFANADWFSPTIPGPAGGLRTTARDLLRWSQALHSGRILKAASLQRMTAAGRLSDGRTTKGGMPEAWQKGLNSDYGMGLFVTPTAAGARLSHGGDMDGFSTWLAHYPDRQVTVALMINSQSADMDREGIQAAVLNGLGGSCAAR